MAANTLVLTYDPKKVILTLGGTPINGYTDGTFVNVEGNAETWIKKVGADGEVNRALSNDNTHTITITLLQTSLSNAYLKSVYEADKKTGLGMLPFTFTDLNDGETKFWPEVWVTKAPPKGRAKETTDTEWVIHTGQEADAA